MTSAEREVWLRGVISRISGKSAEQIGVDKDLEEAVGLDSLGKLEVLAEIEDEFGFFFSDNELMSDNDRTRAITIARILQVIDGKLKEAPEALP